MHYDTPGRKMLPFYLDRWLGKEGGLKEELSLPLLVRGVYSFLLLAGYFQLGLIRILVLYLSAGIKEGGGLYDMEAPSWVICYTGLPVPVLNPICKLSFKRNPRKLKKTHTPCFIC